MPKYSGVDRNGLLAIIQKLESSLKSKEEEQTATETHNHPLLPLTPTNSTPTTLQFILFDSHDPLLSATRIISLVRHITPPQQILLRIVRVCLHAPVGRVGQRRSLRAVAALLLDDVLHEDYKMSPSQIPNSHNTFASNRNNNFSMANNLMNQRATSSAVPTTIIEKYKNEARCLKGEILTTCGQDGYIDPFIIREVLSEGFFLFKTASLSPMGSFLAGKWLIEFDHLHRKKESIDDGKKFVLQAVEALCPKALIYLATVLESVSVSPKQSSIKRPKRRQLRKQTKQQVSPDEGENDEDEDDDDENNDNEQYQLEHQQYTKNLSVNLFADICPKSQIGREKFILILYLLAAKSGNANALNDLGTCFASGFGGLKKDFDAAVAFYEAALFHGCTMAYDNLATHYETGMNGEHPGRIDKRKAINYYIQGVHNRCAKCSCHLAAAYEDGMDDLIEKDTDIALNYYVYGLQLADDSNDIQTALACIRDMSALLITQIKYYHPRHAKSKAALRRFKLLSGRLVFETDEANDEKDEEDDIDDDSDLDLDGDEDEDAFSRQVRAFVKGSLRKVEAALFDVVMSKKTLKESIDLINLVGENNAKSLIGRLKGLNKKCREGTSIPFEVEHFKHLVGCSYSDKVNMSNNPHAEQQGIYVEGLSPRHAPTSRKGTLYPPASKSKRASSSHGRAAAGGAAARKRRKTSR